MTSNDQQSPVRVQPVVGPLGIRAKRREAKLLAAMTLEHLICDGAFDDLVKQDIWKLIDKLRAQRGKRHNAESSDRA